MRQRRCAAQVTKTCAAFETIPRQLVTFTLFTLANSDIVALLRKYGVLRCSALLIAGYSPVV